VLQIDSPPTGGSTTFPLPPAICSRIAIGKVTPLRHIQKVDQILTVYLLVFPLEPYGGGWSVMDEPIDVDEEGNWTCHYQLGYAGAQPKTGDKFKLRAVLVDDRSNLPSFKEPILDLPDDIIASSSDVIVTVERK
jgi:hypothetical protein